jgi:hypothetical protein
MPLFLQNILNKTAVASLLTLMTCSPDSTPHTPNIQEQPEPHVQDSFNKRYPGAAYLSWSKGQDLNLRTYYISDFILGVYPVQAWFQPDGTWVFATHTQSLDKLPPVVQHAFFESTYSLWPLEEVNLLQRLGMADILLIRVQQHGIYAGLYYTLSGDLMHTMQQSEEHTEYPKELSPEVREQLYHLFKTPEIYDVWKDFLSVNIGLKADNRYYMVAFDNTSRWICTFWDITEDELPSGAKEHFMSYITKSSYGCKSIDIIKGMQDVGGIHYVIYFTGTTEMKHIAILSAGGQIESIITAK